MLVQGKEKDPSALQCPTDRNENILNVSIPETELPVKRVPITLDKFRLYLETILILLNTREIAR